MDKLINFLKDGFDDTKSSKPVEAKSDAANDLTDLFLNSLKDIYWAEQLLTVAIPKMIENATSEELVDALTLHLDETLEQITRLEDVFAIIGKEPQAKKCEAMSGLVKESEEIMVATQLGILRDAGIIAAGQKVEHYEIATYGTLISFAKILGYTEIAAILRESLDEEKAADIKLSDISDAINLDASEFDSTEDD